MICPVADLHCDLLMYLSGNKERTILDPEVRCSLPQLQKGGVIFQTLAVFTETKAGSYEQGKQQFTVFQSLHKKGFFPLSTLSFPSSKGETYVIAAIENASCLCEENESFALAFERLETYQKQAGPLLYISLTWNMENRFGGGNMATCGLKKDGELLLEYMDGKGIAIDLSHTSDALAEGILNYIDKKNLQILPIASHSNFRVVKDHPRNLPDSIAKEIVRRGGIIGFNGVRKFVGDNFRESSLKHLEHADFLGALNSLCLGADFFYLGDLPPSIQQLLPMFDPCFEDSTCYPFLLNHFSSYLNQNQIQKMATQNLSDFFIRLNSTKRDRVCL